MAAHFYTRKEKMDYKNIEVRKAILQHAMTIYDSLINIEYLWNGLDSEYSTFISETNFPFSNSIEEFRAGIGEWILTMRYEYDS